MLFASSLWPSLLVTTESAAKISVQRNNLPVKLTSPALPSPPAAGANADKTTNAMSSASKESPTNILILCTQIYYLQ